MKKTYVINPGYFEFGHLLCGKTRDRWMLVLQRPGDCQESSVTLSLVHVCPGSRKQSTRKTQRNSWFITIQALMWRSSSSSSRTLRLRRTWWIHRLWFWNLKRSRCLHRVDSFGLPSFGAFQCSLLLSGGDRVGLPHQGGLDERQPPVLDQRQSGDHYYRLLLLGSSAGVEDGHQTLSFWQDLAAQVTVSSIEYQR